jgi:hypothetical protein
VPNGNVLVRLKPYASNAALVAVGILLIAFAASRLRPVFEQSRSSTWILVSQFIESHTQPDATIFLEHIGLVGYKTDRYIYDSMGLVTPQTIQLKEKYGDLWLTKAARQFDADVVIFYSWDIPVVSRDTPDANWFWTNYVHAEDFSMDEASTSAKVYLHDGSQKLKNPLTIVP